MRVIVCGGRDFNDASLLGDTLDRLHGEKGKIRLLITGMARGADDLAEQWALERGVVCHGYPADWKHYGRRAGPIRNALMLKHGRANLVVAFPGGPGTAHMVRIAKTAGVRVIEVPR